MARGTLSYKPFPLILEHEGVGEVAVNGAHAEYIATDEGGTVLLPDSVPYQIAAPTLCAGYSVRARD